MRWWAIGIAVGLAGCRAAAPGPSSPAVVLLGVQLQRQDERLVGQHFRTLLDFEHPADTAFVHAASRETADGHTGSRSLRSASPAVVSVSSVTFGAALPGDWTLVGGYVRVPAAGEVAATLLADGRAVGRAARPLPAGAWGLVAVDLTTPAVRDALTRVTKVELRFDSVGGGLDLDDVMLIDNRRELAGGEWSVRQTGLTIEVAVPGRPPVRIAASGVDGWSVDEADPLRLRLHDASGRRHWTLLPDGRSIVDGHAVEGQSAGERGGGNASVAEPTLDEADGRLDRQTPGDADNDGYNEVRAAYQIVARRPRLTITLHPAAGATAGSSAPPLLEITGLPPGPCTATAAGQLIDRIVRSDDGVVLVLPPLTPGVATEITVNASGN